MWTLGDLTYDVSYIIVDIDLTLGVHCYWILDNWNIAKYQCG